MDQAVETPIIPPADGTVPFYKEKGRNYPRAVSGRWRSIKWWLMAVLLAWWHLAPFMRWDRGPGAPNQAVLIDMPGRRAYFFFIEIWPQEVYYLTGLLLIAAITLFLMSALAGRVWCGFLCWQTVYTDLFQAVERAILGDRTKRMQLDRAPWSVSKLGKLAAVNVIWAAIGAACGIGFTLWFGNAPDMLADIVLGRAGASTYAFITIIGGFCYLLAGHARERVCVYMCPYSRFQSAMLDEHSAIVSYEAWRGEPRSHAAKGQNFEGRGHCVDCLMCVTSCPTGVDIRQGNQLACIGCGLCIDACDSVMDKFGLPRGLISYDSITNMEARAKGQPSKLRLIRPRTILYVLLLSIVGTVMLTALLTRSTTDVNILHERSPLYVQMADGRVKNGYVFKVLNKERAERTYTLTIAGVAGATMEVVGGGVREAVETTLDVPGDDVGSFRLYVAAPPASLAGKKTDITFVLTDKATGKVVRNTTLFAGPGADGN